MSIGRRIKYQWENFIKFFKLFSLPEWLYGRGIKIAMIAVITIVGSAYIFKVSSSAKVGYQINELENKVSQAEADVQKLNVQIAAAGSMQSVQKQLGDLGMVAAGNVQHIFLSEPVAKK